jgi:hypothetical protein
VRVGEVVPPVVVVTLSKTGSVLVSTALLELFQTSTFVLVLPELTVFS